MIHIKQPNDTDNASWRLHTRDQEPVEAPPEATAADLLHLAAESGLAPEDDDLAVFADDGDEPLEGPLSQGDGAARTFVIGPRRQIEVTVHHNGRFIGQHVSAAMRIGRLRRQAAAEFDLDGDEAELYILQYADTDLRPDEHEHVGSLDQNGDGEVALDLIRIRPKTVTITINDCPVEVRTGRHAVAEIKRLGNVPQADVLEHVVDGRLVELGDDGHVKVKGGEVFVSHPRDSASS